MHVLRFVGVSGFKRGENAHIAVETQRPGLWVTETQGFGGTQSVHKVREMYLREYMEFGYEKLLIRLNAFKRLVLNV